MENRDYAKEIKERTQEAERFISAMKEDIARLADEGGVHAYWGEYGSGETYYPKGTNAEDNYLKWYCRDYDIGLDDEGNLLRGAWVASSDMC